MTAKKRYSKSPKRVFIFQTTPNLSIEERHYWIAVAAYFRAERRGFAVGHELDDWLQAETEITTLLASLEELS